MKKILFLALLAFGMSARGQITLEHDYDSASVFGSGTPAAEDQLELVHFEIAGDEYIKINRHGHKVCIYDINHTLIKTIDFSNFPHNDNDINHICFLYFSEKLFDTIPGIEFMYTATLPTYSYTGIYKDDGTLLFSDTAAPAVYIQMPPQQLPIYNTTQGTKMILSYQNGHAKVFGLPGKLTPDIITANQSFMIAQNYGSISNPYPNPSTSSTKIDYTFPPDINEGEIVFYNLQGTEVKRFKVDKTFSTLLVSTADIAAGTYLYQLVTSVQSTEGKKMVVIK